MSNLHNQLSYGVQAIKGLGVAVGLAPSEEGTQRLGETLVPNIDLWSSAGHFDFLRGDKICGNWGNSPAVVGETSAAGLVNPTASGVLVLIQRATAYRQTAGEIAAEIVTIAQAATYAAVGVAPVVDTRWPAFAGTLNLSAVEVRTGSDPSSNPGQRIEARDLLAVVSQDFAVLPVILSPGFGYFLVNQTTNDFVRVSLRWLEHPFLPNERAGAR